MREIKSVDLGEAFWAFNLFEPAPCLYATALLPLDGGWYQLSRDLRLPDDDRSVLLVVTMAGEERAPILPKLECFSLEVVVRFPMDSVEYSLIENEITLVTVLIKAIYSQTYEICRQRVFRHDKEPSQSTTVRVSALDPGVPFNEKCGEDGSIFNVLPAYYSLKQRIGYIRLLALGEQLITDGKRPFEQVIEKFKSMGSSGRPIESGAVTEANKDEALEFVITKGKGIYSSRGEVTKHQVARACGGSFGISAQDNNCIDKCAGCQAIDRLIKQCDPTWTWKTDVLSRIKTS